MSYLRSHNVTFEPIQKWDGEPTRNHVRSPFRKKWKGVLDLLDLELFNLGAKSIVIQVSLDRSRIRQDGAPRADAIIRDPRVILSFASKHGPQSFPADKFDKWQDNLYAIALSLEALRKVDRYGVTKRGEQYRGFEALPAPDGKPFKTAFEAAAWLAEFVGRGGQHQELFRAAQVKAHPDKPGGDADTFNKVTAAGELLGVA
jgi:hypothetical protein